MKHKFTNKAPHIIPASTVSTVQGVNKVYGDLYIKKQDITINDTSITVATTKMVSGLLFISQLIFDDESGITEVILVNENKQHCITVLCTANLMLMLLNVLTGRESIQSLDKDIRRHAFIPGENFLFYTCPGYLLEYFYSQPTVEKLFEILGAGTNKPRLIDDALYDNYGPMLAKYIINSLDSIQLKSGTSYGTSSSVTKPAAASSSTASASVSSSTLLNEKLFNICVKLPDGHQHHFWLSTCSSLAMIKSRVREEMGLDITQYAVKLDGYDKKGWRFWAYADVHSGYTSDVTYIYRQTQSFESVYREQCFREGLQEDKCNYNIMNFPDNITVSLLLKSENNKIKMPSGHTVSVAYSREGLFNKQNITAEKPNDAAASSSSSTSSIRTVEPTKFDRASQWTMFGQEAKPENEILRPEEEQEDGDITIAQQVITMK